ncbi:hypothetical protein [Lactovum odontotermitis]
MNDTQALTLAYDNTGYFITETELTATGALKITTRAKGGAELLADWGY